MNWNSDFAYAIGLLATDGNLSKDKRHIDFTSKDMDQILNFKRIMKPDVKVSTKKSGKGTIYQRVQFSDVKLYKFLVSIGLNPNKSKTIERVLVPDRFFADFLRGCFDGDGCSYSYWDRRWRSSFMLYVVFASASRKFLKWMKDKLYELFKVTGTIKGRESALQLVYAKFDSIKLAKTMYYSNSVICLKRKRFKFEQALDIINKQAGVEKLVYSLP
jgi:hypothetical protein